MLNRKLKQISVALMLLSTLSWSNSQGLNGILTFDEYDNFRKTRSGVTSFELVDGKSTGGYKEVTGSYPHHHPSGKIVYKQGCGLSIVNREGLSRSIVNCPPEERYHQSYYRHPKLSPSGLFISVELSKSVYNEKTYVFDTHTHTLVFDINGNQVARFDAFFAPTWLPDGRLLLSSDRNRYGLFLTDKNFKNISQIDNKKLQEFAYYPDVSPSGKKVVFEYNQQIWIMNIDGTGLKRLLRGSKRLCYPSWSPDGTYVAYLAKDTLGYYDEAIYFIEVGRKHRQASISTRKVFASGQTGYPDIIGPLSWVSTDFSTEKVQNKGKMPDITKVGYKQKSFDELMELLAFALGRPLSKAEKIAWVQADYTYARGDFESRQKNMKKVLEKFSSMNREIKKIKDKKHAKLVQKYMQEYLLMSDAKASIATSNGMIPKLLEEKVRLPIDIQKKNPKTIPLQYNKASALKESIGIESANIKKLLSSQWIHGFQKQHQSKKLHSIKEIRELFRVDPHTKISGLMESWNSSKHLINYYGKAKSPEINTKATFDPKVPIYLLDTSDILTGYKYLLNSSYIFNIGFDFNGDRPSGFQQEMMSHINRMQFQIDGDKTPEICFDLWFDNEQYASTFMTLLKLKKIELKADYSHTTIDEWLLGISKFKQEGKHVYMKEKFSEKLTEEFIKRLTDEIKMFQK